MTVANPEGSGAVEVYDESFGNLGLEDVGAGDLVLPRLNIDHKKGVFVNSLSKEEFPALTTVVLGLVKQRVMWPEKLQDGDKPRCKSTDNVHGFPRMDETVPYSKRFPWDESNFSPEHARPVELEPSALYPDGWSSNGHPVLQCEACTFSKWGKDRDNNSVPPPCSEQHTYPLLYMVDEVLETGEVTGNKTWVPAIFTVQRSAIKASRQFLNSFAQAKQPFFTQYVGITLQGESRGGNEFFVPIFKKMGSSDRSFWMEYGNQYRGIREMLRSAPRVQEDDSPASTDNANAAPEPASAAVVEEPPAPVPPAAPAAPAPPAQPPVAQPTPPTPPAPPAPPAPVAPPAPAAPATPPAPPAAATPPTPPAPPSAPAAPDDNGLPF